MARVTPVWGIEIGQCALKALRCQQDPTDPGKLVAEAFDYIEYPKILSQPDADPAELVRDAVNQFLSRNNLRGSRVAVSVSGQSGLARFIKLPPVESKKIPDIVKYEAKQQIPFSLDDVVWDYQQMAGGSEADGFVMETEVGLFAMKRDQVQRALAPYNDANIAIDYLQLAPLAIYNYTVFDQLQDLPPPEEFDPDSPPASVAVLSLGTDTSDLVITNGYRVWQRSLPIGGGHFTKALTKELRLTFAKAEHLKKNATEADDPKAIYQAMRPVFADLTTEVQRSINFFRGLDRKARITKVLCLGNAIKLPGLQKYLQQNLGLDCPLEAVNQFRGLTGDAVVTSPQFRENLAGFAICYGLAVQGLGQSALKTNLIPKEILRDRMIRAKKPWAAAAAAIVMLGCAVSFAGHWNAFRVVTDPGYVGAFSEAQKAKKTFDDNTSSYSQVKQSFEEIKTKGTNLTHDNYGRLAWLDVLKAINAALPQDTKDEPATPVKTIEDLVNRKTIYITKIGCERTDNVEDWCRNAQPLIEKYEAGKPPITPDVDPAAAAAAAPPAEGGPPLPQGDAAAPPPAGAPAPPTPAEGGASATAQPADPGGWIIELTGYHYHNDPKSPDGWGVDYVLKTLVHNLKDGSVDLPGPDGKLVSVKIRDLGIRSPVIVVNKPMEKCKVIDSELEKLEKGETGPKALGTVDRYEFVLEMVWQETPRTKAQ